MMMPHPTKIKSLILLIFVVFFQISCEKDSDLFLEAVLIPENPVELENPEGTETSKDSLVSQTVELSPIHDAYIQEGKGYDDKIIRLRTTDRTSYLMFDLSTLKGELETVELKLTVDEDPGDGTIKVFKASHSDWSENKLSSTTAPGKEEEVATISKVYTTGATEKISINKNLISNEMISFVLTQETGNDLSIVSKENPNASGPKLVVTYKTSDPIAVTTPEEPQENPSDVESLNLNADVAFWKAKFDAKWTSDDYANALARSKSANNDQEYYFLAYFIDGLTSMWQATGDKTYLDQVLTLVENTMGDATSVGNGYLGWPAHDGVEYSLWDSYYWRHVATLTRIMHQSPNLRSSGYQAQYEKLLEFSEKHIWDRYESYGATGKFYRSRTHMASHWARIGMELYVITGKQKYKEVFDNISFGVMPSRPSNLRNQLYANPNNPKAYVWDSQWDSKSIQDTSHGGAIVNFWVEAYENGMYWDRNDINALVTTLDEVIWKDSYGKDFKEDVDGGGSMDRPGRLHEWLILGRYSQKVQNKIKTSYILGKNLDYFGSQALGIAALNAKILSDGAPAYPED